MLSGKYILKVAKFQEQYGGSEGSCFGVSDSSRLRRPFTASHSTASSKLEQTLNYGSSPIPIRKGAIQANIEFGQDLKKYLSGVHQRKASYVIGSIANAKTDLIARIEKTESLECVAKLPHVGEAMLQYVRDCVAKEYSVDIDLLEDKKALKAARHQ